MMNHDPQPNARWTMDYSRSVEVVANRPISAGDEICISYGDEPNSELFISYGFTLTTPGPHLCVDLNVALHPPETQQYGGNATAQLRVLANGGVKFRSALAPLMTGARAFVKLRNPGDDFGEARAAEIVVARAVVRCARAEQEAWL